MYDIDKCGRSNRFKIIKNQVRGQITQRDNKATAKRKLFLRVKGMAHQNMVITHHRKI